MSVSIARSLKVLRILSSAQKPMTAKQISDELTNSGFDASADLVNKDLRGNLADFVDCVVEPQGRRPGTYEVNSQWLFPLPSDVISTLLASEHLKYLLPDLDLHKKARKLMKISMENSRKPGQGGYERWTDKVAVIQTSQRLLPPEYDLELLRIVYRSLLTEEQLEIGYWKRDEPEETMSYRLHPQGIICRGAMIYLLAVCDGYEEIRQFACNRIRSAESLSLKAKRMEGFNASEYAEMQCADYGEDPSIVRFEARFTRAAVLHLKETPLSVDQVIAPDVEKEGWFRLSAQLKITEVLRWWLQGFADQVEVLKPQSLRDDLACALNQAAKLYD